MRVRLKQSATIIVKDIGELWQPVGAEVDIPDDHFDAAIHEDLTPPAPTAAPPAAPAA